MMSVTTQLQPIRGAGSSRGESGAEDDGTVRARRCHLHHPEVRAGREVGILAPPEALVEILAPGPRRRPAPPLLRASCPRPGLLSSWVVAVCLRATRIGPASSLPPVNVESPWADTASNLRSTQARRPSGRRCARCAADGIVGHRAVLQSDAAGAEASGEVRAMRNGCSAHRSPHGGIHPTRRCWVFPRCHQPR